MSPLGAAHGALARAVEPLAGAYLRRRLARGKEDPERWREKLGRYPGSPPREPVIWLHAASVGESLSVLPLLKPLGELWPGAVRLLVTTGTPTSAALMAERLPEGAVHAFAPLDLPGALARFFEHWRPRLAIRIESELWPLTLRAARARGIPQVLLNARISERSAARWARAPKIARELLGGFDAVLAQSEADAERLRALGSEAFCVGNLKDAAPPLPVDRAELETARAKLDGARIWTAASTHPGEEALLADAQARILEAEPRAKLILAPRHPERGEAILREIGGERLAATGDGSILLVDRIGALGLCYRLAEFAFVGGSLVAKGGQNPLEPARLGAPALFGPHMENFADTASVLIRAGAARRIEDAPTLARAALELFADGGARAEMGAAGARAAASKAQVIDRAIAALAPIVKAASDARS